MKALVFTGPREYAFKQVDTPKIERDKDVLVEIKGIGLCNKDVCVYSGRCKVDYPHISGHEFVGFVKEVGSKVENIKVGDYVTVEPNFSCKSCDFCMGGKNGLCSRKRTLGFNAQGCFCEMTIALEDRVRKLPGDISLEEGTVIEAAAAALHGINKANIKIGNSVLVMGADTVGILVMQLAKLSGAEVHIADSNKNRLRLAEELGADYTYCLAEETITRRFDIVLHVSGAADTINRAVNLVRHGGRIVFVRIPADLVELDVMTIIDREIKISGSTEYTTEFGDAINLIEAGKLNVEQLVTHKLSFDDLVKGIELMESEEALKSFVSL